MNNRLNNLINNDLLNARRIEEGRSLPFLQSSAKTIKKGALIGSSFISAVLLISLIILMQTYLSKIKLKKLKPIVDRYDLYTQKIKSKNIELSNIEIFNKKLAKAIVNIRSGSALLKEISNIVPQKITITSMEVLKNDLTITGIASLKDGIEIVNVFMIEINSSPFINAKSVKLLKADKLNQGNKEIGNKDFMSFSLSAKITDNISKVNQNYLNKLGSVGLSNRVSILNNFGLLK